jgi:integrase
MASFSNRSRYTVSVTRRPDLARTFPHTALGRATEYRDSLRRQGHNAKLRQGDDTWLVRIGSGKNRMVFTTHSRAEAECTAQEIAGQRARGLMIDYTAARKITFAQLVQRYIDEECPRHKGCEVERYTLNSLLDDAYNEAGRRRPKGSPETTPRRRLPPRHTPRYGLAWFFKNLADVLPTDIEDYVSERIGEQAYAPSTVDRELDLISQIVNWARKTLRIHLHQSPMYGVRRPRYYNERNRRLSADEERRLFEAARTEDRLLAHKAALQAALAPTRAVARTLPNESARKRHLADARTTIEQALPEPVAVPYYEALLTFLLETAARRGEALNLTWSNVNGNIGHLPDTKNGRARDLALRSSVLELLARLPRTCGRVFPMSINQVRSAWNRICERAGITDFHMHDLRHEATSRIVEVARKVGSPLDVHELAAITGHRDLRCLARYTNLCMGTMAIRLDELFERARKTPDQTTHKGRVRPSIRIAPGSMTAVILQFPERGSNRPTKARSTDRSDR